MPTIPARWMLAIVAFYLFIIAQMNRVNINLAIVVMEDSSLGNNWDAKVVVLGAFYWCYSLIELPGTFYLRKYGCRKILTINVFLCAICNFLFPTLYLYHPLLGIFIRAFQGLTLGITWPAIAEMSAKWIPMHERSKFTSTYQGTSVGSSLTYILGGIIIYSVGWPYLFYLTGVLSLLCALFWWFCAYDSPATHPRISDEEKFFIESQIADNYGSNQPIPWKSIAVSKPFWAVFIGTFGIMWFVVTINMQLPSYLNDIHHVNIRTNGTLLAIPDLVNYIFSLNFSIIIDRQIKNGKLSVTNARKIAFVFSHILPGLLLILLGFYGKTHISVAMLLATFAVTFGGATSSGNLANIVDISPNNAGIIMGICKSLCLIPGILSPIIVKCFTESDPKNWFSVFFITTAILFFCCTIFFFFGSGEIQNWDKRISSNETIRIKDENKTLMKDKRSKKSSKDCTPV